MTLYRYHCEACGRFYRVRVTNQEAEGTVDLDIDYGLCVGCRHRKSR